MIRVQSKIRGWSIPLKYSIWQANWTTGKTTFLGPYAIFIHLNFFTNYVLCFPNSERFILFSCTDKLLAYRVSACYVNAVKKNAASVLLFMSPVIRIDTWRGGMYFQTANWPVWRRNSPISITERVLNKKKTTLKVAHGAVVMYCYLFVLIGL